jgi:hypothetical protein
MPTASLHCMVVPLKEAIVNGASPQERRRFPPPPHSCECGGRRSESRSVVVGTEDRHVRADSRQTRCPGWRARIREETLHALPLGIS